MKRVLGITITIAGCWLSIAACTQQGGPVKVDSVEPPQGTTAGGDEISIVGGGFQPGKTQAEVKFGRKKAENVTIASTQQDSRRDPAERQGPGRRASDVRRRCDLQDCERVPLCRTVGQRIGAAGFLWRRTAGRRR